MRQEQEGRIAAARRLLAEDIRRFWPAVVVLGLYFLVGRRVLHSLCPSVFFFGLPCPGCGMTRAMFAILRGRFADAWRLHPFSYVLLLYLAVLAVRRYMLQRDLRCLVKYAVGIGAAMVVFYAYRMIRYFPGEPPMSYYSGSVLGRILSWAVR